MKMISFLRRVWDVIKDEPLLLYPYTVTMKKADATMGTVSLYATSSEQAMSTANSLYQGVATEAVQQDVDPILYPYLPYM